jgi:hypothetical protein
VILLAGCGSGVSKEQAALFEQTYNEARLDWEPLCIEAGPFPLKARRLSRGCDRCEDLVAAKLLTREVGQEQEDATVRFDLTESGKSHYNEEADPEQVASVKRRYEARREGDRAPDAQALGKPRLCFGKERFHHITESLGPISLGGVKFQSVKLVAEVKEPSPLLWDPALAPLKLTIPPRPKEGQPVLYPPRVVTFRIFADGKSAAVDDMRYGKWVNEK